MHEFPINQYREVKFGHHCVNLVYGIFKGLIDGGNLILLLKQRYLYGGLLVGDALRRRNIIQGMCLVCISVIEHSWHV